MFHACSELTTSLHEAQEERLAHAGIVTRNTFIDLAPCHVPDHEPRSRSVPATLRLCCKPKRLSPPQVPKLSFAMPVSAAELSAELEKPNDDCSQRSRSGSTTQPSSPHSSFSMPGSTPCSVRSLADGPEEDCPVALEALAKLVHRECSFLQISKYTTAMEVPPSASRWRTNSNTAKMGVLHLFLRGVPSTTRALWLHPLLRSVSAALMRCGLEVTMKGKEELTVHLESGMGVLLKFVAIRG